MLSSDRTVVIISYWPIDKDPVKILVTGGGGFLGRGLCHALKKRGDQVVSFQRRHSSLLHQWGIEQICGDLSDFEAVMTATRGVDLVIHTAAKAGGWGDYRAYYQANVVGTDHILDACRHHRITRLLYTSTPSVVHQARVPVAGLTAEDIPYATHFLAHYPATKAIAEQRVLSANSATLATIALRPRLIWGPDDPHLLPRLINRATKGRLRLIGDGTNQIDTTFITNAVHAHLTAAYSLQIGAACAGRAYFISNNEPIAIAEFLNKILAALGAPPLTKTLSPKMGYRLGALCEWIWSTLRLATEPPLTRFIAEQMSTTHWYSMEPARRDFGYIPVTTMAQGLAQLAVASTSPADAQSSARDH